MPGTSMRIGLCLAGLLISAPVIATPPSDECSQQADRCKEAYDALDTCLHNPAKVAGTEKKDDAPPKEEAPAPKKHHGEERPKTQQELAKSHRQVQIASEKPADNPDACPAEKANAESVCKASNSVCVGGVRKRGHAAKD